MSNLNQIEASFQEINSAYEHGDISKEEYINLLQGLEVEKTVTMNAEDLQRKEEINSIINAAISAASLVA